MLRSAPPASKARSTKGVNARHMLKRFTNPMTHLLAIEGYAAVCPRRLRHLEREPGVDQRRPAGEHEPPREQAAQRQRSCWRHRLRPNADARPHGGLPLWDRLDGESCDDPRLII